MGRCHKRLRRLANALGLPVAVDWLAAPLAAEPVPGVAFWKTAYPSDHTLGQADS